MKTIIEIPDPPGLPEMAGLTGEAFSEAKTTYFRAWADWRRLHALRLISGREVPRCCWPVTSPMEAEDAQVCGITDLDMLAIDHIFDDGKADREKYRSQKLFINAILTGAVDYRRLQVLCHNHNNKKAIQSARAGNRRGAPRKFTDEALRAVSGLHVVDAAAKLGVSRQCIMYRRRALLDFPQETMVD